LSSLLGYQDESTYTRCKGIYLSEGLDVYLMDHRVGYEGKLTSSQIEELTAHLSTISYRRSQDVMAYILATFQISYSDAGCISLLHRLGYSYQQVTLVNENVSVEKQAACIEQLTSLHASLPADEVLLFGDGVHPTHNTNSVKVWAKKGSKPQLSCNTGRNRININAVLNIATFNCTYLATDTINAVTCLELFEKVEREYADKKIIHIVVDNARYYKNKTVQEYLKTSRINLIHIPPYCPNLNLIERLWKYMKKVCINGSYIKQFKDFQQNIFNFLDDLTTHKDKLKSILSFNFQVLDPLKATTVA
jgi:transposase